MESERTTADGLLPVLPPGTHLPYVVLHHTGIAEPHFDLMVDVPGRAKLVTWRIKTPPAEWSRAATFVPERIQDHRRVYLTFEGPLSENRGTVARVAAGTAIVSAQTRAALEMRLEGAIQAFVRLPVQSTMAQ